jgi:hypothetical protein
MRSRRLLTLGAADDPIWVRLYIQQIGDRWTAMLVADEDPPSEPVALKGLASFGAT